MHGFVFGRTPIATSWKSYERLQKAADVVVMFVCSGGGQREKEVEDG